MGPNIWKILLDSDLFQPETLSVLLKIEERRTQAMRLAFDSYMALTPSWQRLLWLYGHHPEYMLSVSQASNPQLREVRASLGLSSYEMSFLLWSKTKTLSGREDYERSRNYYLPDQVFASTLRLLADQDSRQEAIRLLLQGAQARNPTGRRRRVVESLRLKLLPPMLW